MGAASAVWWLQRCEGHFISRVVIVIQRSRRRLLETGGRSLYRANGSSGFPHWLHHDPVATSLYCENSKWRARTGKFMSAVSKRVFKSSGPTAACLIWLLMIDSEKKKRRRRSTSDGQKDSEKLPGIVCGAPWQSVTDRKTFPPKPKLPSSERTAGFVPGLHRTSRVINGAFAKLSHKTSNNFKLNVPVSYNQEI